MRIRPAHISDLEQLAVMCEALWPKSPAKEHAKELRLILGGNADLVLTMPISILIAEASDGTLLGFVEVDLRSHADGCNPSKPVGYIEGWYVAEPYRQRGVGRKLLVDAEEWARNHNCVEIASDATIDNERSQRAHDSVYYIIKKRNAMRGLSSRPPLRLKTELERLLDAHLWRRSSCLLAHP